MEEPVKGRLKIGDEFNAITIIALSQNNPLKAIAEFVENSIDAKAKNITIIRGKQKGEPYFKIQDDGTGIHDFKYVATHIGDSIKRTLKKQGAQGLQGEFGIGLLSFWTIGETLTLTSDTGSGCFSMKLEKGSQSYTITPVKSLFESGTGTELFIWPLLPGIRQLSGEKIQNYLASELRDRIRKHQVQITIIDKTANKLLKVEPRQFEGRLLHHLPAVNTPYGEIYTEIYINEPSESNQVGLYKLGTRVFQSVTSLPDFQKEPWNSRYLQGIIDVPFLQLTPGTRDGIIYDSSLDHFIQSMAEIEKELLQIIETEKKVEEDKASQSILTSVRKAFTDAFYFLPKEEYDWLSAAVPDKKIKGTGASSGQPVNTQPDENSGVTGESLSEVFELASPPEVPAEKQQYFFEMAGALYKVLISPAKTILKTKETRKFSLIARDKNKREITDDLLVKWEITEGGGTLSQSGSKETLFTAPEEPGVTILSVTAVEDTTVCKAEAVITISETLLPQHQDNGLISGKGLPGYTFKRAPGELWRSRYDQENNLIEMNTGHADFIYASKNHARKLRYICKLYSKELVLFNFSTYTRDEILERFIELSLYTEEHLK